MKSEKKYRKKFKEDICDNDMTFEECELSILRHAMDETEKIQAQRIVNNEEVKRMIGIVEEFLARKKLVCYGGTAINNILPKYAQFYNRDVEIPDYDFYSPNAMEDAIELANIYHKKGYLEVEAKSGVHHGTYKVFVNFIPIADITLLHKKIFHTISKESIKIAGILYSPPNFLRMNMYLELSRPAGDVSRWEKVLKRLNLLNEHYPMKPEKDCHTIDFQRPTETLDATDSEKMYLTIRDSFVDQGVIFFGGYATSLYSKYMTEKEKKYAEKIPDFDVLSEEPEKCATIVKERLMKAGFKKIKIVKRAAVGEIIPENIEIRVGNETMAFIYKPIACHSYNKIHVDNKEIHVASIDTILTFYLAFTYADEPYYNKDRLICMANFLFRIEQQNRLEQKGLLKRFSIDCFGKQPTMEDLRSEKAQKFKELMGDKAGREYQSWFLKYNPAEKKKHVKKIEKPSKPYTRKNRENVHATTGSLFPLKFL